MPPTKSEYRKQREDYWRSVRKGALLGEIAGLALNDVLACEAAGIEWAPEPRPEGLQSDSIVELVEHVMKSHRGQFGRCAFADLERIKEAAGRLDERIKALEVGPSECNDPECGCHASVAAFRRDRARLAGLDALLASEDPPLELLDRACYGAGDSEVGAAKVATVKAAWRWFRAQLNPSEPQPQDNPLWPTRFPGGRVFWPEAPSRTPVPTPSQSATPPLSAPSAHGPAGGNDGGDACLPGGGDAPGA